ncbi:hypothetical protein ABPG72_001595 [Tetrahymena utriculariae]
MRRKEEIQNSLSVLIESYFEQKRQQNYQEFSLTLYKNLINDSQFHKVVPELLDKLREGGITKKCMKLVLKGEVSFVCEECSFDIESSLICKGCFIAEDHLGHKVHYSTQYEGICDCGDIKALKFVCSNHSSKGENILTYSQNDFEKEKILHIVNNFKLVLKQLLNLLIERAQQSPVYEENVSKGMHIQKESLCSLGANIVRFLHENCIKSEVLMSSVAEILLQGIKQAEPSVKLSHNCQKLTQKLEKKNLTTSSKNCDCTYLELLLRSQSKFKDEVNEAFLKLYEQIMKFDENFANILAFNFVKLFRFFFYETNLNNLIRIGGQIAGGSASSTASSSSSSSSSQSPPNSSSPSQNLKTNMHFSKTLQIYCQFFTANTASQFMKSKYFVQIYEQWQDIIRNYFLGESRLAFNAFNQVKNLFSFILSKKILVQMIDLKVLLAQTITCIFITHTHKSPEVSDEIEKMRLVIECGILMLFKKVWSRVYELFENEKNQRIQLLEFAVERILTENKKLFLATPQLMNGNESVANEDISNKSKNHQSEEWPIHFTGFRMLSIVLNLLVVETKVSSLKDMLLSQHFEGKHEKLENYIAQVIQYPLKAMNFARTTEQKVGNYYQMMSDPQKSMKIEIINSFYKKSFYGQMDLDISLIQVLLAIIKEKNSKMPLMNIVCTIYSEIDIKQIYFSTQDENYKKKLGSVLELFAVLAVNNACILNTVACSQILQKKKDHRRPQWLEHHLHCVLINAFHLQKVHDLKSVKDVLYDKILNYEIKIEPFIFEVTEQIAPSSRTLRLKPEFQRQYEPFLFHKYTRLSSNIFEKVKELSSKFDDCDPIIGNISLYTEHSFLRTLLNNLFSDEVPRYLMLCFRIDSFNESLNDVLKFSIKLVGLYLTFCIREIIELKAFEETRQVFDHLLKYFLKPELEKKLSEMKKNRKLSDIKQTIENIQRMISLLKEEINEITTQQSNQKRFQNIDKSEENIQKKDEQKKQQTKEEKMKKQQERIKQEFMRKQQQFQQKNQNMIEQETSSQQQITNIQPEQQNNTLKQQSQQPLLSAGLSQGDCGDSVVSCEDDDDDDDEDSDGFALEKDEEFGEDEQMIQKEYINDCDAVCSYCHYPVEQSEYGLYCYISEDYLIYYSLNLNNNYSIHQKEMLLNQFKGYRIETCGHYIHRKCKEKLQRTNINQILQKRVLFSTPYENLCGQCKGLSNLFLPIVLSKQIKLFSFFKLQKILEKQKLINNKVSQLWNLNQEQFEQLVNKFQTHFKKANIQIDKSKYSEQVQQQQQYSLQEQQKILEIISDQFTQILQLKISTNQLKLIHNADHKNIQSKGRQSFTDEDIHEDYILYVGERIITHLSDILILAGWNHFFNKCFKVASNFFASFREFLHLFESNHKEETVQEIKQQIICDAKVLETLARDEQQTQQKQLTIQEIELNYFKIIWRCAILERRDHALSFLAAYRFITRRVFEIKIRAFYYKFVTAYNMKNSSYLDLIKMDTFEYEILTHVLPFMKASLSTLFVVFHIKASEIKELDDEKFESDVDQYNTFQKILTKIDCQDVFDFKTVACLNINQEQSVQNADSLQIQSLKIQQQSFQTQINPFKMVILPKDFLEFNRVFSLIKCSYCNDYPKFGDPYLCLICEKVTCSIKCDTTQDCKTKIQREYEETYYSYERDDDDDQNAYKTLKKKSRRLGNLNKHANHYHGGKTAYLHLKNGQIILVNYPKNIFYGWIYTDEYGQIPNPKNNKWDQFKINYKIANKVQEILIQSKIPQEICYNLMQDSNILIDRDYI